MAINFKDIFGKVLDVTGQVLKQVVIQEVSKIPAVENEIEKQKVVAGKNVLWTIFPWIAFVGLTLLMIGKFK